MRFVKASSDTVFGVSLASASAGGSTIGASTVLLAVFTSSGITSVTLGVVSFSVFRSHVSLAIVLEGSVSLVQSDAGILTFSAGVFAGSAVREILGDLCSGEQEAPLLELSGARSRCLPTGGEEEGDALNSGGGRSGVGTVVQ